MSAFAGLSRSHLQGLSQALAAGRMTLESSPAQWARLVPEEQASALAETLNQLALQGLTSQVAAFMFGELAQERARTQAALDRVGLVWSGIEMPGSESRDTRMVVRELFAEARHHVLLSSYALDQPRKARALFKPLAENMALHPQLRVQFYLHIKRPHRSQTEKDRLLWDFAEEFRRCWPAERLPEVYHDPRTLDRDQTRRVSLHAKCLVVDFRKVLITSANYTEAAQDRNIEAGLLVDDAVLAGQLINQFDRLRDEDLLTLVPGLQRGSDA